MRKIDVLAPLTIHGVEYNFHTFVEHMINNEPRFNNSGPGIRAGARIEAALKKIDVVSTNGHDVASLSLEESDWKLLQESVESPAKGYPELARMDADGKIVASIGIGRFLLPFIDAIRDAKEV